MAVRELYSPRILPVETSLLHSCQHLVTAFLSQLSLGFGCTHLLKRTRKYYRRLKKAPFTICLPARLLSHMSDIAPAVQPTDVRHCARSYFSFYALSVSLSLFTLCFPYVSCFCITFLPPSASMTRCSELHILSCRLGFCRPVDAVAAVLRFAFSGTWGFVA